MKRFTIIVILIVFSAIYCKAQTAVSIIAPSAGWYRVAEISGSAGRGQHEVTIYTSGGSYAPHTTTVKWFKGWSNYGGMLITNESTSAYWSEARITFDGTLAHLEFNFTTAVSVGMAAFVHESSWGFVSINAGTLPQGGGEVVCQAKIGKFNVDDKLYVGYNSYVGIGTTSPDEKLDVVGRIRASQSIDVTGLSNPTGMTSINMAYSTSSDVGLIRSRDWTLNGWKPMQFQASKYLFYDGNVGMGTTNPGTKLHIYEGSAGGGGYINTNLRIENSGGAFLEFLTPDNQVQGIMFSDNGATYRGYIRYNHADNSMRLWTNGSEKFTILSSGNVGIGTTSPAGKLHSVKNANVIDGGISQPESAIIIGADDNGNDATLRFAVDNTNLKAAIQTQQTTTAAKFDLLLNPLGGNIGIGTTTIPSDYKLAVAGKIIAKEVKVTLDGWSDFVFTNNYQLKTLTEVEDYITQNKHLPDVPSAAEVKENGVNLGQMDAVLLQKIEELTLYIIEQDKKFEKQNNRISELENIINQ